MTMEETQMEKAQPEKSIMVQTLLIGGVLGALVGVGAAYLLTRRAALKGAPLSITPKKGVQLGVLLAGLMRSILQLGED
jgi:ABC-type Mn2+/Zn2+ transport system permease subunit